MKICIHDYVKTSNQPIRTYCDYSGFRIGVFKCKCVKCGKIKEKKFLADRQIGELFK